MFLFHKADGSLAILLTLRPVLLPNFTFTAASRASGLQPGDMLSEQRFGEVMGYLWLGVSFLGFLPACGCIKANVSPICMILYAGSSSALTPPSVRLRVITPIWHLPPLPSSCPFFLPFTTLYSRASSVSLPDACPLRLTFSSVARTAVK